MAARLPRFIVINSMSSYSRYAVRDATDGHGTVKAGEGSVFSTLVKIEVEPSSTNNRYVHLRFCSSNRYWQLDQTNKRSIVAQHTKPVEDTKDPSSTLFEPTILVPETGVFYLTHVQTGHEVVAETSSPFDFYTGARSGDNYQLHFVNWDTLVKLPSHVAFKGYNGNYLQGVWAENHQYLQFAADDPNSEVCSYRVALMSDGYVRIKSDHFNRYWQYQGDWIYASITDPSDETNTLFWPVKLDDNTIALRCFENNMFCRSLDYQGKTRCLNASAASIIKEATIGVQELVMNRKIYNVKYRMEDARIYGEKPYLAGTTTATNTSNQEGLIGIELKYEDSKTYSFSRSISLKAGVKATIEAGIPLIGKTSIEISFEVSTAFEWGQSETTTTSVTATGSVPVPAKSVASVEYVATMGTCDIPYSYTQREQSSTDGTITETVYDDGVYTGINCYNFNFVIKNIKTL